MTVRNSIIATLIIVSGCCPPQDCQRVAELSALLSQPIEAEIEPNTEALEQIKDSSPPAGVEQEKGSTLPDPAPPAFGGLSNDWYLVKWTMSGCPPCRQWDATERPQCTMTLRVIDGPQNPSEARKHGIRLYPTFQLCSRSSGKVLAKWTGFIPWSTIEAKALSLQGAETTNQVLSRPQVTNRVVSQNELIQIHNRLHGGGSWTWPGDLETHLREVHGYNATTSTSASCPDGNCPTPTRRVRWRLFRR